MFKDADENLKRESGSCEMILLSFHILSFLSRCKDIKCRRKLVAEFILESSWTEQAAQEVD